MREWFLSVAAVAALTGFPLSAQSEDLVRASDPAGMVRTLKEAGYDPELTEDSVGDPMIKLTLSGYRASILFYNCEDNKDCQSIQFSAGFDRDEPWNAEAALKMSNDYRYMAVRLDEEGDPYIRWDVEVGDGLPKPLFLRSVLRFTESIDTAASVVFAE